MFPQPMRTLVAAVAGALVLPALAVLPTATASGGDPSAEVRAARPTPPAVLPAGLDADAKRDGKVEAQVPAEVVGK